MGAALRYVVGPLLRASLIRDNINYDIVDFSRKLELCFALF